MRISNILNSQCSIRPAGTRFSIPERRIMVSLLIVSHSAQLAAGVKEFAEQVAGGKVQIADAGGTADGSLGTSVDRIQESLQRIASPDGTLVLVDLGSAVLSVELAIESIGADRVQISDAPLVEG